MQDAPRYLGIDLGTTNSAAAVFDGETLELVRAADGATLTPSVVRIDARGRVSVGSRARRSLETDPENTRSEFKRLMGTDRALKFPAAGQEHRPEVLAARVLESIREDVRAQLGFVPERAVISVPALFELPQSSATSEAARLAGFERVELIQEPVASALAAGWSADDDGGGAWLVYDIGGGTFDVSLLETRDGLLRVVGHDGDNFLGGRDIDRAIVDWALRQLRTDTRPLSRSDPTLEGALGRLKAAAEEAKIDLTRRERTQLVLPDGLQVGDEWLDVDLALDRDTLEQLMAPLVERSLAVCTRLLTTHGLAPDQLSKVVLVGGPTVVPYVRQRVAEALATTLQDGLDPMTLVARGAALYAATASLDARPTVDAPKAPRGRRLWLQYPAMSSDLFPHVAGRLLDGEGTAPAEVRFVRSDGAWESEWTRLGPDGGLVVMLELSPRRPNTFRVEGRTLDGANVEVQPASLTVVQGMTITDPPLSRSVGVALASDRVHVYLERGTPLPAKRTFVHHTVEGVPAGVADAVLTIPIVQGELEQAHLCRLVGRLEIGGQALTGPLPAGSPIEVTVEVDRGGRLSARALVPQLEQVFEQVAHLVVPDAPPDQLDDQLRTLKNRLEAVRAQALRQGQVAVQDRLFDVEWALQDAAGDISAARGGDDDAAQKARRTLLELDATLASIEDDGAWPELESRALGRVAWAGQWVAMTGTEQERAMLEEATAAVDRARRARRPAELQRQLRVVGNLGTAAYFRHPDAWRWSFEGAASDISRATDLARAQDLVQQGREALAAGDQHRLRDVVNQLWRLLPEDDRNRHLGYGSGLR